MDTDRDPIRAWVAVHVALVRGDEVWLLRRASTGFMDGCWSLPTGHVEVGECPLSAAVREVFEEAGVLVAPDRLELFATTWRGSGDHARIDLFFRTGEWSGKPTLAEPGRADSTGWFAVGVLPGAFVPHARDAMRFLGGPAQPMFICSTPEEEGD